MRSAMCVTLIIKLVSGLLLPQTTRYKNNLDMTKMETETSLRPTSQGTDIPQRVSIHFTAVLPLQSWMVLTAVVLIGFALRLQWMIVETPVMGADGAEYARMAESLFYNHALVGNFEGPQTLYAPLYPVLIAGVMFALPNVELAAHIVSLLLGTALIVIIFLIARYIYGQKTAYICAALVAVHPVLVALSGSVYNETAYLTLLMAAIYWGLRALELHRRRDFLLLGAGLGLAYLTRVEAFVYVPFFIVALLTAGILRKKFRVAVLGSTMVLAIFFALASPYIAFFYQHTGSVRLEAKWNVNYTMARNRLAGMSSTEADYGINTDLTLKGPILAPFEFANITPYPHSPMDKLRTLIAMVYRNKKFLNDSFLGSWTGSPLLVILVTLGLFRQTWSNQRFGHETVLLMMAGSIAFFVITASNGGESRYFFATLPMLLLWAGKGIGELGEWLTGCEVFRTGRLPHPGVFAAAFRVCAVVSMILISAHGTKQLGEFVVQHSSQALAAHDAALWLAHYQPGPKRIAVRHSMFPYYAKGTLIGLPYADAETTLRYIAQKNVDFVVLESSYVEQLPTIGVWLAHGILDDRARLIYDRTNSNGDRVAIYRWQTDLSR